MTISPEKFRSPSISGFPARRRTARRLAMLGLSGMLTLGVPATAVFTATPAQAQIGVSELAHQQFVFAYRLLQRGDTKLAIDAFDDYLGKFPHDEKRGDALYFRALLAKQQGQLIPASKFLDEKAPAPTLVPQSAVLLLKGEVAADLHQYDKALKSLEQIDLKTLEPALRASALFLRGQAYRGANNMDAAATQFTDAAKIDSALRPQALLELARVQAKQNKITEALAAAKSAATSGDPKVAPSASRLAGDLAYQSNQYASAKDFYKLVLTNYSKSDQMSPSVLGMMWAMLGMKQYPEIISTFDQYKADLNTPNRVIAWYLTGSAYQELGQQDKAAGMFNALVLGSTGTAVEAKAIYKLTYAQVQLGQYDQALQTAALLRKKHPNSPLVIDSEFLLASVEIKRGNPDAAITRVTRLINQGPTKSYHAQALLLRARFHVTANQPGPAAKDYAAFLAAAAKPAPGSHVSAEMIDEASLRLIDLTYSLGQYKQAAQVATHLLARKDVPAVTRQMALYRQALALIRLKDLPGAHKTLTALITGWPKGNQTPQALYYRGLVSMALKHSDEAVTDLLLAANTPALPQALKINALRLASIRLRETKQHKLALTAITSLQKFTGLAGLSPAELLWMAQARIDEQDPKSALAYLKPITDRQTDAATDERASAVYLTAVSLRMDKQYSKAVDAFRNAIAMGAADASQTRLDLAATLAQMGKTTEAMDEYRGLINSEKSAVASAAIDQTADIYIKQAQASAQTNDDAGSKADYDHAKRLLKRLVLLYSFPELSPLPELSYVKLVDVELALGEKNEAKRDLAELQEKYPNTAYAQYAKATLLMINNIKPGDALFLFKELAKKSLDAELAHRVASRIKTLEGQL